MEQNNNIIINSSVPVFVIYPRNGYIADGVRFVTTIYKLSGSVRPDVGSSITKANILHTWWCSMTTEEVKRMYKDGITLDRIITHFDVIQLG